MPSLSTARRVSTARTNGAKTIGQAIKEQSDFVMEQLWESDVESKVCYIYDYYHDDQPKKKDHMTYEYTTKTRIDAKFIMKSHQSLDKDQTEYYLQFKPSQKLEFVPGDELYYFETDYKNRYGVDFPIGLYCDLANEKGVYEKWLIVGKEISNQFTKYLILPINYELTWIEHNGQHKFKRRMWGITRSQNSYNVCASYRKRYVESFLIAGKSQYVIGTVKCDNLITGDNQQRSFLFNKKNVQRSCAQVG